MTNEELQAHIDALNKAVVERIVQFKNNGSDGWFTAISPLLIPGWFRIKPQPREVWILRDELDDPVECPVQPDCHVVKAHMVGGVQMIRFREVLEGDSK